MSELGSRAAGGLLWTVLQTWSVRLATAVAFVVLGRELAPSDFGVVAIAYAVITVVTAVTELGLATYLIQAEDVGPRTTSTAFWVAVGIGGSATALLFVASWGIGSAYGEPRVVPIIQALSLTVVISSVSSVPSALLLKDLRFKTQAVRITSSSVASSVVGVVLALSGAGAWALVGQGLSRAVLLSLLLWLSTDWRPSLGFDRARAREIVRFGTSMVSISLLQQGRERGEDFVLGYTLGATVLGYWSVATRLIKIVLDACTSVINTVATPTFATVKHDLPRLRRMLARSLAATALLIFPVAGMLVVLSPQVVPLVLGQQWVVTGTVAQVAALTAMPAALCYFDRSMLVTTGHVRAEVWVGAGVLVAHLAVVVALSPLGVLAVAWGIAARTLLTWVVRFLVLRRCVGVSLAIYAMVWRVGLAAALMMGAAALVSRATAGSSDLVRVLLAAPVGGVVYLLALLLVARPLLHDLRGLVAGVRERRRPAAAELSPA